ncbi:hypothetical protein [Zooshikella sp. RANM57]|uniref:hypothetical protein n=1 Tax=Zooshikella sp. RANM57 TaxID=3425863 RepID=UPI003D6F5F33
MEKWKPNERVIHFIKLEKQHLPPGFRTILSTTQLDISASIANRAIAQMMDRVRHKDCDY